ncbi:hypothetical protein BT69DRAFT_1359214 [Atractiella rhizophila]|nr:hypothetical protein BT69DRAFT_1359214 [Atractiella rhizophila]
MPSQAFRTVVIPIVIGTWTNAALWGLEVCMVYLYYSRACSRDGLLMRTAVAICTIVDTACTAVTMSCRLFPLAVSPRCFPPVLLSDQRAGVYGYTVTNWGNEAYLLRQGWHFPAYVLLTGQYLPSIERKRLNPSLSHDRHRRAELLHPALPPPIS